ncbi:MAG: magnesium/cobalt transporter CorA [Chloroflexi bacterium]|nr:magnesium/cobalt transporter CorA [Chloroflexota bacterium]
MAFEVIQYNRVTWTNIIRTMPEDVEYLRREYPHFHPLDLEDLMSTIERPKLDEYDDYLFVVLQFPIWDPVRKLSRPSEVDIFVGSGYLVTAHDGKLKPLETLFRQCQSDESIRQQFMGRGASKVFYAVIDYLVDYLFPMMYKIDAKIRRLEEEIFMVNERRVIQDLALVRRDIIALRRIVQPQIAILQNLERIDRAYIREELDVYFGDILDHLNKATDLIAYHGEVVFGLTDTANTLANLYTNDIMWILTLISVIMMPLTLVSGIYGMNVMLPLAESPIAFVGILMFMVVIALSMLFVFRRRGWL